jgi:hypothetical protein
MNYFFNENHKLVSRSSFQDLGPCNVLYKSVTPHNVCVCIYHENIAPLLKSLNECIHALQSIGLNGFIRFLDCDDTMGKCMFSSCYNCSFTFKNKIQEKSID